jgi:PhoPQ-activated pathogenicity-related protein
VRRLIAGLCISCISVAAAADDDLDAAAVALERYIAKADASYAWHVRDRREQRGIELAEVELTSQTWQGVTWKHQLALIVPRRVRDPGHALLIVGGGRWREGDEMAPLDLSSDDADVFVAIARQLESVLVVVGQVPFQPLFGRSEDELIAYSFDRYLETADTEWPLLLPMVKGVVRAMDASSAAAAELWGAPLQRFTVLGGSKRGWTTWLTAAVDTRVIALAPVVMDALNMRRHFPYQTETWGRPSDEIRPYTDRGLDLVLGGDEGAALRRIVDPFEYRSAITQPKLVVLATNDRYFPVDAANLYWDALPGPKHLLYLPNDEHGISDYRRLIPALGALHAAAGSGDSLPRFDWEYLWNGDAATLCLRFDTPPRELSLWTSASADRDFRDAVWLGDEQDGHRRFYRIEIPRPATGYAGAFAEASFGRGRSAYSLSTNLAILSSPDVPAAAPRPHGTDGVCE